MSNDLKRQIPCRIPDLKPSVAVDWEGFHIPMYFQEELLYMGVSKNNGTPKSSILMGFSIIKHPFWGTTIFGNTHMIWIWNSPSCFGSPRTHSHFHDFVASACWTWESDLILSLLCPPTRDGSVNFMGNSPRWVSFKVGYFFSLNHEYGRQGLLFPKK